MEGIAVAGTLVVDTIKMIDGYPEKGMIADISRISRGIGGCAANTACGVKLLDPSIPVKSLGLVGDDDNGAFVIEQLSGYGIDAAGIRKTTEAATSFSDVMTIESTGERTFFHDRGACRLFAPEHVDLEALGVRLLLLGYGALLDSMDREDAEYGTMMARFLHDVKERGILTAMDVASTRGAERMKQLVLPSLKYTDHLIVNEVEGGMLAGIAPRDADGNLKRERLPEICGTLKEAGVAQWVVIHAPELGCAVDENGAYFEEPSLTLPKGYIVGAVGAGDAFCAGVLYAVYRGLSVTEALRMGAATAAANLSAGDAIGGLRSVAETRKLYEAYGVK
ncbi:MAG: carbohydrate kinase family protein [Lachnospiraceae bacterium]|nr:carbohydrate kinase family protein [Lachnospiraceae bacterium]